MKHAIAGILAGLTFFAVIQPAQACKNPALSLEESVRNAPIVFSGTLKQISALKYHSTDDKIGFYELTFSVDRTWRGRPGEKIVIRTANSTCGLFGGGKPEASSAWLIVASGTPVGTSFVSGSQLLRAAGEKAAVGDQRLQLIQTRIGEGVPQGGVIPINLKNPKSKMYHLKG